MLGAASRIRRRAAELARHRQLPEAARRPSRSYLLHTADGSQRVFALVRQRPEQNFTLSQSRAHFLRHANGLPQAAQSFSGRFVFRSCLPAGVLRDPRAMAFNAVVDLRPIRRAVACRLPSNDGSARNHAVSLARPNTAPADNKGDCAPGACRRDDVRTITAEL